jgi:Transcription factor TFIIH complex subunit Tfb5
MSTSQREIIRAAGQLCATVRCAHDFRQALMISALAFTRQPSYSDIPTKQFILHLNSKQAQGFIINDLDDTHVFVEANAVQQIR